MLASEDHVLQRQRLCQALPHLHLGDSCPQGAPSPPAQDLRGAEFLRTSFYLFETEAQKGPATCAGPRAMSEGPVVPGDLVFHLPRRGEGAELAGHSQEGVNASRRQAGPGKRRLPLGQLRLPGSVFSVLNMDKETVIFRKQMVMIRA